jgi:tetratricopeptide (TPR) repeat protein
VLVGALVVLGPSVYFVNAYQVQRNSDALKRRANQAFDEARFGEAAKYYYLYLIQHPDDIEARIGRAEALDKKSPKSLGDRKAVFDNFEYVLRLQPERDDIRRRQVDLALSIGERDLAMTHIQKLLEGNRKDDGELEQLQGLCYAVAKDDIQAEKSYELAIKHAPQHLASYVQLANLYLTRVHNPVKANEIRRQMVQENGEKWEAHLAAAEILRYQGQPEDQEVEKALQLAPDQPEAILEAAATAQRQHNFDRARELLERGLKQFAQESGTRLPKDIQLQAKMYYRLARVEIDAGRIEEAEKDLRRGLQALPETAQNSLLHLLALVLIQRGDIAQAEEQIKTLHNRGASDIYVDELKARVLMHKEEWGPARQVLEGLRPFVAQQPDLAFQVEFFLGRCYEGLREPDRALASYTRALDLKLDSPDSPRVRRGKASAFVALGKPEEAIDEYRRILLKDKDPAVALPLAQLLADRNRRLDPEKQDWKEVENVLRAAPASAELAIFKAQLAQLKNPKEGLEALQKERDKDPSQLTPWVAMIEATEREGDPAKTLALIVEAEQKLGDRVELRLARARYWLRQGGEAASTALIKLEQNTGRFSPADQARLLAELADLYIRIGNDREAKRLWTQLAQLQPNNLRVRMALCELAYLTGAEGDFEPLLREIRALEGENGPQWRYAQACRIILAVRLGKAKRDQLAEARELLANVTVQRPKWGRAALREAEVAELEDNHEVAVDLYKRALSLGERDPAAFRPAVYLLYKRGNLRDAEKMIATLQEQTPTLPIDLRQLRILILGHLGNSQAALDLAAKAIQEGSKNPADHFWYAQSLAQLGRKEEAEKAYRAALLLPGSEKLPEIWVQFVLFLARTGQKTKAEEVVREAEKKVPADKAHFVLAQCYEALNDPNRVEQQYLQVLEKNPRDRDALRNLVNFYDRNEKLPKAEPYLRRLLEPETKATDAERAAARRGLALCLAGKGDWEQLQEAIKLLNQNMANDALPLPDQHALAKIYAKHTYYWRAAMEIFEQLQKNDPGGLTLDEQLELARLYEQYGPANRDKAREIYLNLLPKYAENPAIIYLCLRNLLRLHRGNEQLGTLPSWLVRLKQVEGPQSTRVLEIQVRLLKAQGNLEEGAKALKEFAERSDATDVNLQTAAALLEEFGKPRDAEELYRKLVAKRGSAGDLLLLAAFLGRQGRDADIQEALDLCDRAWKTPPPNNVPAENVAFVALAILGEVKKGSASYYARVERGLTEALSKSPNSLALLFYLAGLRSLEQKYDEAEKAYRQILERDRRNVLAQNNLAWLLAARGGKAKAGEALDLIKQAIQSVGPSAELLDTEAFIYLQMDNPQDALKDLQKALEEEARKQNPSAVIYFHLARAQELLKDPEAIRNLEKAQSLKLKVHPLEQPSYDRLLKALGRT